MAKKKNTTNKKENTTQNSKEVIENLPTPGLSSIIKIAAVVLVIFGIMYLLTVLILKKSSLDYIKKDSEKTSIQYSEILAGTSFSKKDSEYLVLYYDKSSNDASIYEGLYSDYKAKDEHLPIYYVDLSKALNKQAVSDESNKDATSNEELKVKNGTLIRFVDKKIEEYFEGEEEVKGYFKD